MYNKCSNQVIMSGFGGAVALNQLAVMQRIEMAGIKKEDQEEMLDSVMLVASTVIQNQRESRSNETTRES